VHGDLNQGADDISKIHDVDELMLKSRHFFVLNLRWGLHTTFLLASNLNAQCETIFSKHSCPSMSSVNVLGFSSEEFNN
jgi:hypothetical protein